MSDYDRVAKIIEYLADSHPLQPSLEELASIIELSPAHFQRLFVRWAGVSPKKFLQSLTVQAVRKRLADGQSVLSTAFDEGLSGPGRLHDLTVSLEAASPGEIKSGGEGWTIRAGYATTPLGQCLITSTPRGIGRLDFVEVCNKTVDEDRIRTDWPKATILWDDAEASNHSNHIFDSPERATRVQCLVKGSQFQLRVWQALLRIPKGQLATYQQIATAIGNPKASRAVGTAIGSNPIGYLIPCHRVIRKTGVVGEYRWGTPRKQAAIAREIVST